MNVVIEQDNGTATVAVTGEIDSETSPQLELALSGLTDQNIAEVVVNMAAVSFISSAGLGVLIATHQRLADQGSRMVLLRGNRIVDRVVALTGLEHLYTS